MTLTSATVWFGTTASSDEESTIVFDIGLYTSNCGGAKYLLPPLITLTELISSRLSKVSTGEMKACGLNVLSEE